LALYAFHRDLEKVKEPAFWFFWQKAASSNSIKISLIDLVAYLLRSVVTSSPPLSCDVLGMESYLAARSLCTLKVPAF
jgi:hypothetical protein